MGWGFGPKESDWVEKAEPKGKSAKKGATEMGVQKKLSTTHGTHLPLRAISNLLSSTWKEKKDLKRPRKEKKHQFLLENVKMT